MLTPEQKIKDYVVDEVNKLLKEFHAIKIHIGSLFMFHASSPH
jgi:hypothetical protein